MGKQTKSPAIVTKDKKSKPGSPPYVKYVLEHYKTIAQVVLAVIGAILGYLVWRSSHVAFKNLVNVDEKELSAAFLGKTPHIFMCNRGGKEVMPPVLSELHGVVGSKVAFGIVNCSQILPSGKNMWDRFKLKKEWRPTVFITSPWAKPYQILPTNFKDLSTLRKSVDTVITPKAKEVEKDSQLAKICSKSSDADATCLVLVKGKRYSKEHADLEEKLVLAYPDVAMASIKAQNKRLSFEDSSELPFDQFALKLFALRNGTHYMSMVYPVSWTYIKPFVDSALSSPIEKYFTDKLPIKLVKPATSAFKQRMPPMMSKAEPEAKQEVPKSAPPEPEDKGPQLSPEEEEARRQARERQRREAMEKEQKEQLFEGAGEVSAGGSHEDGDEEDVIEL